MRRTALALTAACSLLLTLTPATGLALSAPISGSDNYTAIEDSPLIDAAPGGLRYDSDPDGDSLTAELVSPPAHGTVSLNADGSFIYTPEWNYNGTDAFSYRAQDSTGLYSAAAVVNVWVLPSNDGPISFSDSYLATEDTFFSVPAPGVMANDSDDDGDILTAQVVTGPTYGSLTLNPNGSFGYTPALNYCGPDSFMYEVSDGRWNSPPATVSLEVRCANDAPFATDDSYTLLETGSLWLLRPGLMANDFDLEGDTLTARVATPPEHGTLALNPNGSFTYQPDLCLCGGGAPSPTDSFTYIVSDGLSDSLPATVSLTILPVNEAPVARPASYSVPEDTSLTRAAPGLLSNAWDSDGDLLTATLVSAPAHGAVVLNPNGSFSYTPSINYNGSDSFTYRAFDGTAYSAPAVVTLNVQGINDVPVAAPDTFSTPMGTALAITQTQLLANDSDVDGSSLTVTIVNGPSHGSLIKQANGSFTYTPAAKWTGTDTFTYVATDGQANSQPVTVTITVVRRNK